MGRTDFFLFRSMHACPVWVEVRGDDGDADLAVVVFGFRGEGGEVGEVDGGAIVHGLVGAAGVEVSDRRRRIAGLDGRSLGLLGHGAEGAGAGQLVRVQAGDELGSGQPKHSGRGRSWVETGRTSVLPPVCAIFLLLHSARRPAMSRGRFSTGRSVARTGEGKVAGPVMCRLRV